MQLRFVLCALALLSSCATLARAGGVDTVRTRDGGLFRGEIVESVPNDHVVIRIPTGSLRRVAWNEIVRAPLASVESPPPLIETVRTRDGSLYRGEIVERVRDDHVAIKNATGAIRFIAWRDLDESAPTRASASNEEDAPEETVWTVDGSEYRGVVIERVVGDHVSLRISNGAVRVVPWGAIDASPKLPVRLPADVGTIRTEGGDAFHGAIVERVVGERIVVKLANGNLQSIAWEDVAKQPKRSYEAWLAEPRFTKHHAAVAATPTETTPGDGGLTTAGSVCIGLAIPHLLAGIPVVLATAARGNGGGETVGAMVLGGGVALLVIGIVSYMEGNARASHPKTTTAMR